MYELFLFWSECLFGLALLVVSYFFSLVALPCPVARVVGVFSLCFVCVFLRGGGGGEG